MNKIKLILLSIHVSIIVAIVSSSCVDPFQNKKEKPIEIDTNGTQSTIENNSLNNLNHDVEPVDKFNIAESPNSVTNLTYKVNMAKPRNWKRFHGQAEHTILKVANKKMGAQVSLIRIKEIYNNFTDSELDLPSSEYITKIAGAGINFQNAKEIETTFLGYRAKRIDANYLLYQGDLSIVENYIAISFVKDGALYTVSATFPQILSDQVMSDIDRILNSINFN